MAGEYRMMTIGNFKLRNFIKKAPVSWWKIVYLFVNLYLRRGAGSN